MPTYEMPLLLRVMKQPECVATLKRVTNAIFETGGFIRKIENWGERELPMKASSHGKHYKVAHQFLICFDIPPSTLHNVRDEFKRDIDIIRSNVYIQTPPHPEDLVCTLHEELLPAPYRPSVLKLLDMAAKRKNNRKQKFNYGSVEYYPFLK
ncbi:probable 28S ribosomal protein S6, mitochondrial [Hylaeus volcanicus]|uniref:probable 28S ribosomal protein S6, mitochondrial n=1 Tax=Hylaeus volcanicus TaxID=313075 RepID=UPI0023B834E2|nr:probable 28S ribosomal protein S6, mitochondrial [Hylaeus volcanicus]